jgi:hypothetical protein
MAARNGMGSTCFLMLAMMGGEATTAELRAFMRREGEDASAGQVQKAVQYLCGQGRPLVEKAERQWTRGAPYRYRLTGRGHAILARD